jgi:hypothetical protein
MGTHSAASITLRFLWMLAGPITLAILALVLFSEPGPIDARDAALGAVALGCAFARFADTTWFGGATADGRTSTMADVARYVAAVLIVSIGILALARAM